MKQQKMQGTLCALASAIVFGMTPVLARMTFDMGSNPLTLTFYRNALAVPVLLVLLLLRRVDLRVGLRDFLALAVISIAFSVTTTYILYDAYNYIGIGLATTLHFLYPMFTVLFGWLLFRKKLSRVRILALLLSTVGVVIATGTGNAVALKGILLAITSAITYAGYLIGIERTSIGRMDSMKSMFYMCVVNAAAVAIFDLPGGNIVYALPGKTFLYTLIMAIANSVFAYVLLIVGIKLIGAGNAAIFSMMEPVSGVAAGVLFLHEGLPINKLISCLLILVAVGIPIFNDYRGERKENEKISTEKHKNAEAGKG